MRQDAIMQQVFEMLNTLLHKNPGTRKRNLSVRQYKVWGHYVSDLLYNASPAVFWFLGGKNDNMVNAWYGAYYKYVYHEISIAWFVQLFV